MRRVVVVDIDGCISDDTHRRKHAHAKKWDDYHGALLGDSPMNQKLINELSEDFDIVYCTGRNEKYIDDTELWLKTNFFPFGMILMRGDSDYQSAVTLKPQLLRSHLGENFADRIHVALDNDYRIIKAYLALDIHAIQLGIPNEMNTPDNNNVTSVPEILTSAADLYRERNREYSDNYKHFGSLMKEMFPSGVPIEVLHSNEFGVFIMLMGKMSRLASSKLTHEDSAKDMIVYASMLYELIMENKK